MLNFAESVAETFFGAAFPPEYRSFLATTGWAEIGPQEINGLDSDVPAWMNIIETARWETANGGLPKQLVPLHADGGGNYICIDLRHSDLPIVFWAHEDQSKLDKVADTFTHWAADLIAQVRR